MSKALAAGIALLGAAHTLSFRTYLTDDAFISFRYLDHWLAGDGLVYNVGERVWGFTNFGWIVLLAPFRALGADPVRIAQAVCLAATVLVALAVVRRPDRTAVDSAGALLGLLLLATNAGFLLQAWSGLETSVFTACILASLFVQQRAVDAQSLGGSAAAGVLAALATLTRPEGAIAFAGSAFLLWRARPAAGPKAARSLAALFLGFAPLVLLAAVGLQLYYEALYPNSVRAKVGASWEQVARGIHYVAVYAWHHPGAVAVLVLCALGWRRLRPLDQALALCAGALAATCLLAGGDWMFGYRLLHPVSALSAVIVPGLLGTLVPRHRRAVVLGGVCAAAFQLGTSAFDVRIVYARQETYVHQGIEIGRWLRSHMPPDTLLATNTAGTIPYYSGLPTVDMMGLADRTIAARTDLPEGWHSIEKGDGAYVLGRRPDLIQFASSLGSYRPMSLSDVEIYLTPSFHRDYDRIEVPVDPETRVKLFRRRAVPRAAGPTDDEWVVIRNVARTRIESSRYRY